jgi:uroporphyrinogen decarboxylase
MTSRQLLFDTFDGKKTERIPVAPFIFQNVVCEYHPEGVTDMVKATVDLYKHFGFDILMRSYVMGGYLDETCFSCDSWKVEKTTVPQADGGWDETIIIQTPERQLRQKKSFRKVTANEVVDAIREYFIKTPEDFEQFEKYQPAYPQFDCSQLTYARELVGDDGLCGTWIQGAFNMAGMYRNLEDLLADPYEDEEFYARLMEYFTQRIISLIPQLVQAGCDFLSMGGNMASGSTAGPAFFESFIMPYENRVIDAIHAAGARCIYHNCGDAKQLLPVYAQMPIDMYETLTHAPYGDTVLEDALQLLPKRMVLSGNLDQISFLKDATPDEVRDEVKRVVDTVKDRGNFILAASDYFSEGTPEENLFAFAQAAKEFGRYEG